MVNERPVVDGHVLICPVRQVRSMRDLTELEYLEMFACAREVAKKFQNAYKVQSFTFVMHDGDLASEERHEGLCLQAIPSTYRSDSSTVNPTNNKQSAQWSR